MFGEPFDSDLQTIGRQLQTGDLVAAQAGYARLLATAERLTDSPDTWLLRAHLLAGLAQIQLAHTDLAAAAESHELALGLLRDIETAPMPPAARRLWLDTLLKVLADKSDRLRAAGDLVRAEACLDEAERRLPELGDRNGLRAAELATARVQLLMERGNWGRAEELALSVLSTVPATVEVVPHLLASLGQVAVATGRLDLAEDSFARAAEALRAAGHPGEVTQLLCNRADVALHRGDLHRAEQLYAEALEISHRRGQPANVAICEQALAGLAMRRGDRTRADQLLATSLASFEEQGMSLAAADTMVLASQQAYGRGDFAEMRRLCELARASYEEHGAYHRCAEMDYLIAATFEDSLNRSGWGEHEELAVDAALGLALPATLALSAARYDFAASHARAQWLGLVRAATGLVFRLAARRRDLGLRFELLEFHCAGAPLALDHVPSSSDVVVFSGDATTVRWHPKDPAVVSAAGAAAGDAAARVGLRVALPPKVVLAPGADRTALSEYVNLAEARYHRRVVSDETVDCWLADEAPTRPVVQVRFADAGDLFLSWRWLAQVNGVGAAQAIQDYVDGALAALAAALPSSGEGMRRAFESAAMAAYHTEQRLARALAEALWPAELTEQLRKVSAIAGRPLVRVQPSPRIAQVPWELLALDGDTRLVELADVVTCAPLSLRRATARPAMPGSSADQVVLILDPQVPGFADNSRSGRCWGSQTQRCSPWCSVTSTPVPPCRRYPPRHKLSGAPTWTGTG